MEAALRGRRKGGWRPARRLPLGDTPPVLLGQKCALMEQVAHQTIVMQFILELAKSLKVDPRACFRQFFTKIKVVSPRSRVGRGVGFLGRQSPSVGEVSPCPPQTCARGIGTRYIRRGQRWATDRLAPRWSLKVEPVGCAGIPSVGGGAESRTPGGGSHPSAWGNGATQQPVGGDAGGHGEVGATSQVRGAGGTQAGGP